MFRRLSLLNTNLQRRLLAVDGVAQSNFPMVVGFSAWMRPNGAITPVYVVGSDFDAGGLSPCNVAEGTFQSLTTPGTVAIDRSYYNR